MTVITATCERCAGRYGPDYMDGNVCVFCSAKLTRARLVTQARQAVDQLHGSVEPVPRHVALLLDAVTWLIEAAELPEPGGGR